MTKVSEGNNTWLEDNFFVYTSENAECIESHLYGFAITNDGCRGGVFKNCVLKNIHIEDGSLSGSYILIEKEGDEVTITQDAMGSYFIYVFQQDDFWAISNSFWLICDEVSKKYALTLNVQNALHFMNVAMSQLSVDNTLANEIKIVPLYSKITIIGKKLKITEQEHIHCIYPIESKETLKIIDEWINKWAAIIKYIYDSGMPLQFDLSGGFDSRVMFAVGCAAGVNFSSKNVLVNSVVPKTEGQKRHYKDDYEIAERIAGHFAFSLNVPIENLQKEKIPQKARYQIFQHTMMNTHREVYLKYWLYKTPLFHFGGFCGEPVRGKTRNLDTWVKDMLGKDFKPAAMSYREFFHAYKRSMPNYSIPKNMKEYVRLLNLYLSTWNRNHYGLAAVNNFIANEYTFIPLGDESLLKINPNSNKDIHSDIVYALILLRACPELLEIPFADNQKFDEKTLNFARQLNKENPFELKLNCKKMDVTQFYETSNFETSQDLSEVTAEKLLEADFLNEGNKNLFIRKLGTLGEKIWNDSQKQYTDTSLHFPTKKIAPIVAAMKMLRYENPILTCDEDFFEQESDEEVLEMLFREELKSCDLKMVELRNEIKSFRATNQRLSQKVAKLERDLNGVRNSWTYKVGSLILYVPKKIKGLIRKI